MKNKLIFELIINDKLNSTLHRIASFICALSTISLLVTSDLSIWLIVPLCIIVGVLMLDVDSLIKAGVKNENN